MTTRNSWCLVAALAAACSTKTGPAGQQGPQGPPGPTGMPGAAGQAGASVTSSSLDAGDPHCPAGGAAFSSASGIAYACNGSAGPAGPGLTVNGNGVIPLAGPPQLGASNLTCTGTIAGALRYLNGTLQLCDGTSWTATSGGNNPTAVPGLLLWAEAGVGYTLNGGSIATWADQSGHGNDFTQASATSQPLQANVVFNGQTYPVVSCTQAQKQFMANAANFPAPVSVFYVGRMAGAGTESQKLLTAGPNWYLGYRSGGQNSAFFTGAGQLAGEGATNNWYLWEGIMDGNNGALLRNGNLLFSIAGPATGPSGLELCGVGSPVTEQSTAQVAEVLVYGSSLQPTQRLQVESYLSQKFGLPLGPSSWTSLTAVQPLDTFGGPLPVTGYFTAGPGLATFIISGSGFASSASLIGVTAVLDGVPIGQAAVYANEVASHKQFTSSFVHQIPEGGQHTFVLTPLGATQSDFNDRYNATVIP